MGVFGYQGDIISILKVGDTRAIRQDRTNVGAVDSNVTVQAIEEQTKEGGLRGQPCFTPVREGWGLPTLPITLTARLVEA